MNTPWSDPRLMRAADEEFHAVVTFAKGSKLPTGFGYLDSEGAVDPSKPVELWITCRMTHVFALAHLAGIDGMVDFVTHGVESLRGPLHDDEYGGWYSAIGTDFTGPGGQVELVNDRKEAYAHAFVILAATSAVAAGISGAQELLDDALKIEDERWWEPQYGRVSESYNRSFTEPEDYRGINANMHTTECFLSAFDITHDRKWLDRAHGILRFVHDSASQQNWRIPEHFTSDWKVLPDYNLDQPAHPFRPFGVTPGHGLEWARLMLQARAALLEAGEDADTLKWMLTGAQNLFARAVRDGWDVDGAPGFVYTTDFDGKPVVRERMHWVVCEAISAAVAIGEVIGDSSSTHSMDERDADGANSLIPISLDELAGMYTTWVDYSEKYLREGPGRWIHELDPQNRPASRTWPGKPDAYHVAQMLLFPRLPLTPTFAAAIRAHLLKPLE